MSYAEIIFAPYEINHQLKVKSEKLKIEEPPKAGLLYYIGTCALLLIWIK
jgi:hypothetical protein